MKPFAFFLLILVLFPGFVSPVFGEDESKYLTPQKLKQRTIAVEDLGAEYHSASGMITVKAKLKNVSNSFLRGYATIYLLSESGKELYSFQEDVNNGDTFAHGTVIPFKATSHVGSLDKVNSITVDFTSY